MTATPEPAWRPLGASDLAGLRDALAGPFLLWIEQWFFGKTIELLAGEYVPPGRLPAKLRNAAPQLKHPACFLDCSKAAQRTLGALALDTTAASLDSMTDAEAHVVDTFCHTMSVDLQRRIDLLYAALPANVAVDTSYRQGAACFALRCHEEPLEATIWLSLASAMRLLTPRATARVGLASLTSRRDALLGSHTTLEGVLGTATLTLAELRDAEVGDVIRMSTRLDDHARLFLVHRGQRTPLASAALVRYETSFALQIETIISGT